MVQIVVPGLGRQIAVVGEPVRRISTIILELPFKKSYSTSDVSSGPLDGCQSWLKGGRNRHGDGATRRMIEFCGGLGRITYLA